MAKYTHTDERIRLLTCFFTMDPNPIARMDARDMMIVANLKPQKNLEVPGEFEHLSLCVPGEHEKTVRQPRESDKTRLRKEIALYIAHFPENIARASTARNVNFRDRVFSTTNKDKNTRFMEKNPAIGTINRVWD
jgi:hypothetical protein